MAWRVGSLKVTGDSYVITGDRTNPAAVPLKQKIDVLEFGELASATPDKDTPFEISMHPEKYTAFQYQGRGAAACRSGLSRRKGRSGGPRSAPFEWLHRE